MRVFHGPVSAGGRIGRIGRIGQSKPLFALARALPFAELAAVLTIELSPAHFLYTGPLLSPAPALAAVTMGPVGTGFVAFLAGVVSAITATVNHAWGTQEVYANLLALLVVTVASVAISLARVRRERELSRVRRIAEVSQDMVVRPVPPRLAGIRAAGVYLAAEEGAHIGGDLYEAVDTPFGVRMIVGDVRGKGLPAVRSAATVLGAFREAAQYEPDLAEVVRRCEAALRRDLSRSGAETAPGGGDAYPAEQFVTAVLAQVPDGSVVELVSRGHPPPLMLHRGEVTPLETACPLPPLGLEEFLTGPPAAVEKYPFGAGDRLLLHTDGVLEARDRDRNFFDLPAQLAGLGDAPPEELLDRLRRALAHHTRGHLADDAAMILIERDTGGGAGQDRTGHPESSPASRPGSSAESRYGGR
ncbi:PP2C family protein-serine/threonine phosphatase [Streptomyces sp. NPDC093085]|uniref:PP2C family protein-serine/threonine phosphatase n=1 Tax=Streptomyces sp. NPDC093085 TaxID=3155068 RepID=UPI0034149ECA